MSILCREIGVHANVYYLCIIIIKSLAVIFFVKHSANEEHLCAITGISFNVL